MRKKRIAFLMVIVMLLALAIPAAPIVTAEAAGNGNAVTELSIKELPEDNTIAVGSSFNFDPEILATEKEKGKATGVIWWEVNAKTSTAGVSSSRWGNTYPVYEGSFEIRALAFASTKDLNAWKAARKSNKNIADEAATARYATAVSDWVTIEAVSDKEGYAVARTQYQLDLALKNKNCTDIHIVTDSDTKFTIASKNYGRKTLTIEAPNADIDNSARFAAINIEQTESAAFTEKAIGNIFVLSGDAVIHADKNAHIREVQFAPKEDAKNPVINIISEGGRIDKITVEAAGEVKLAGETTKAVEVEIAETAGGTKISTGSKLVVNTYADVELETLGKTTETQVNLLGKAAANITGNSAKTIVTVNKEAAGAEIIANAPVIIKAEADVVIEKNTGAEGMTVVAAPEIKIKGTNNTKETIEVKNEKGDVISSIGAGEKETEAAIVPTQPIISQQPTVSDNTTGNGSGSSSGGTITIPNPPAAPNPPATPNLTLTPSPTAALSPTSAATPSSAATLTPSPTAALSPTSAATPSSAATLSPTPAAAATLTPTATLSPTPIAPPSSAPEVVEGICTEYSGSNKNAQNYNTWANTVNSYLTICEDGSLMRFQYAGGNEGYLVEYYDTSYQFLETKTIAAELPIFGAFYAGKDNYFILTGQRNRDESPSVECYRITKYDKNWNRIDSAGLYDCNTTVPFDAGSARIDEYENFLFIRTCHEMYTSSDGLNHQANVMIQLDMDKMQITDSFTGVMNTAYGYVSHSFNQFLKIDDGKIVSVDHGDAYPRSVVLIKYNADILTGKFSSALCNATNLLTIPGDVGANYTGVSVGGFECSDTAYLAAGNKVDFDSSDTAMRNIFVASMSKATGDVKVSQITNYGADEEKALTPHLVKASANEFVLLWSQEDIVFYTWLDKDGTQTGEIHKLEGNLSDCVPLVLDGKIVWYTWKDAQITFYEIDKENSNRVVTVETGHSYKCESVKDHIAVLRCTKCGKEKNVSTPASFKVWWKKQDNTDGSYSSGFSNPFKVDESIRYWIEPESGETSDLEKSLDFVLEYSNPEAVEILPDDSSYSSNIMGTLQFRKSGQYTLTIRHIYDDSLKKEFNFTVND